jgi:hypothetical protein
MKKIFVHSFIFVAVLKVCFGQQAMPEIPPGPLVKLRAPNPGQWTVVNTFPNAAPAATTASPESGPKVISSYIYVKTGNILHVTYTDFEQRIWQIWNLGKVHAFIWADGKSIGFEVAPLPGRTDPLFIDTTNTDFPDFNWLAKSNFVDIEPIDGKQCLVFQTTRKADDSQQFSKAMVDVETRLPVRYIGANGVSDYKFADSTPAAQSIPGSIQAAINGQSRKQQLLARIPIPAY